MNAGDFGRDFTWGVSTAAYQTEGAIAEDGKGPSIWDQFTARKGRTPGGETAGTSCAFYHDYIQYIILLQRLGIPAFRFSIAWTRIFPEGIGKPNPEGVDFYNRVIDFCLELGITPWVTLYHWDLPEALQSKGGWCNRDVTGWFSAYVAYCAAAFGDRVKHWMVLNEPLVFTGAGHFFGVHAPGVRSLTAFLRASHHAALCQAEGGRILKSAWPDARVGTTFSCTRIDPASPAQEDHRAAARIDALLNRMFVEPLLGLGYPIRDLPLLRRIEPFLRPGDEKALAFDMDFLGIQNYTREVVRHTYTRPLVQAQIVSARKRGVPVTEMGWEIFPEAIYDMLRKFGAYPGVRDLVVTENGAAFADVVENGRVHDHRRIAFLQDYLAQVLRAKREGVPVSGYFAWTLMDNFEWAEGYRPRFGLVHVDFRTQRRIVKDSGYWFRDLLRSGGQERDAEKVTGRAVPV